MPTPTREHILAVIDQFFDGPATLDRLSLMTDDVEWWNGLAKMPLAPGQTVFRGKDEIGRVLLGRAPSPPQPNGRAIDRYDLSTKSFADVLTFVDGHLAFRQHTYRARTLAGSEYENVYGFVFRFAADGRIDRIWEHWGTLEAYETLFQGPLAVQDFDLILQTTPSVRKRLDLTRPVSHELIEQCLDLAVHAPNGSNLQPYRFVFIDDAERRAALADIYRAAMGDFVNRVRTDAPEDNVDRSDPASARVTESVMHLARHLHEVPVLCVPIVAGRTDGRGAGAHAERTNTFWQAGRWGSVIPALWSFMLALRSRGLGSAWTTLTLLRESEVAEVLGIPGDEWMQVGLFPIAHTLGTDFKVTPRRPAGEFISWNGYGER